MDDITLDDSGRLLAIEEIKQLKGRYFYHFDHKDWEKWRDEVWAPDGRLEVPEIGQTYEPRDPLIAWVISQTHGQSSVHHGHMPIITLTSDTTATGIWAMEDRLYRDGTNPEHGQVTYLHGFGHYHETYVKLDVGWRLQSTRLTRLRVDYASKL